MKLIDHIQILLFVSAKKVNGWEEIKAKIAEQDKLMDEILY